MSETKLDGVLDFERARHVVEQHARQLHASECEALPLLETTGRVLAENICADRDFPPFSRSTRDGFAVRFKDVSSVPTELEVIGEVRAGGSAVRPLRSGEAIEIMTGAPLPSEADAVVMVEHAERRGDHVIVTRPIEAGQNYVPRASEARRGDILLSAGHYIDHTAIAIAGSVGCTELKVYRRPHVAILSTGDEIVDISVTPKPNQIRNSNSWSLATQVLEAGGIPQILPIAPDEPQRLRELIAQGLQADLLLVSGGVSMGKYDLVEQAFQQFGAEFFFTGAQIQPGRPIVFGRAKTEQRSVYFFGLPGNPVSTIVTFLIFAQPMILALGGARIEGLRFVRARLRSSIRTRTGLTRFLPAVLSGEYQNSHVEPIQWQGSGDISALARANCYLVIPPDRELLLPEDLVDLLLF